MAGNPGAAGLATESTVEEMSMKGSMPPPQFFLRENAIRPLDSHLPPHAIPTIDISLLSVDEEIQKLKSALISWGCFQAVGHSSSFLDKVRGVAKQFFALPAEEKHKYSPQGSGREGYGHDRIISKYQARDWMYRLALRLQPVNQRNLQFWPENPKEFREVLDEYGRKVKLIMDDLFKAMAKSLHLEEDSFTRELGK